MSSIVRQHIFLHRQVKETTAALFKILYMNEMVECMIYRMSFMAAQNTPVLGNQALQVICQSEVVLGLSCCYLQAWLCRETVMVVLCAVLCVLLQGTELREAGKTWHGELGATIPRLGELPSRALGTNVECPPMAGWE